jgi:hypothetical protein
MVRFGISGVEPWDSVSSVSLWHDIRAKIHANLRNVNEGKHTHTHTHTYTCTDT